MTTSRLIGIPTAILLLVCAALPARAGDVDGPRRRQLAELKKLCDAGLIAPPLCLERQRVILGLPLAGEVVTTGAPVPAAPPVPAGAARVHESRFGFRAELPPGWTTIGVEELEQGLALIRARLGRSEGDAKALGSLERLEPEKLAQQADLFVRGREHIRVTRSRLVPGADPTTRPDFCRRLDATTSAVVGRRLHTYACGSRVVAGASAFVLERDALLPGFRTIQYWLPAPQGDLLQLVLTCEATAADAAGRELEQIVESIRWR